MFGVGRKLLKGSSRVVRGGYFRSTGIRWDVPPFVLRPVYFSTNARGYFFSGFDIHSLTLLRVACCHIFLTFCRHSRDGFSPGPSERIHRIPSQSKWGTHH